MKQITQNIKRIISHVALISSEPGYARHWADEIATAESILARVARHIRHEMEVHG